MRDSRQNETHQGEVAEQLPFDALDILARPRVDFDQLTHVNESRTMEFSTGFHFDGFGDVGCSIAFRSRLAVFDTQHDMVRWRDGDGIVVKQHHRADHPLLKILPSVVDLFRTQLILLIGSVIHEDVGVALSVKILGLDLRHVSFFEGLTALVGSIKNRVADEIPQPAFVERVSFTGFDKVALDHQIRVAVDLDLKAFAKVAGAVRSHVLLPF